MKNQNSISKPTVIIKPPPSVSAVPSSKKEKLPIEKKMDLENNQQQQLYDDNNFSFNINDTSTTAETPLIPLTDKVKKQQQQIIKKGFFLFWISLLE
jgi:hypothetical protein